MKLRLTARGKSGHAARPHLGQNAIVAAARDVLAIEGLSFDVSDPFLGEPTAAVTMVKGGVRSNVIPDSCELTVDCRTVHDFDNERMVEAIRAAVSSDVEVLSSRLKPVAGDPGWSIARAALEAAPGRSVTGFPSVSDLAHLAGKPRDRLRPRHARPVAQGRRIDLAFEARRGTGDLPAPDRLVVPPRGSGVSRRKPLWGAGFSKEPGKALARISLSHPFDRRLLAEDLAGTRAHARGLRRAGLLSKGELARIERALSRMEAEAAAGRFRFRDADEDVHLNVERRLIELAGEAGRRIHAGRSRNDQVALDLRLWTLGAIGRAGEGLARLGEVLLDRAEEFLAARVLVAARTHMRSAQPVLLAHVFHAYAEMLARDLSRLADTSRRTAISPLGSGACAGTTLPLDRERRRH